jgi:hypothetical protein
MTKVVILLCVKGTGARVLIVSVLFISLLLLGPLHTIRPNLDFRDPKELLGEKTRKKSWATVPLIIFLCRIWHHSGRWPHLPVRPSDRNQERTAGLLLNTYIRPTLQLATATNIFLYISTEWRLHIISITKYNPENIFPPLVTSKFNYLVINFFLGNGGFLYKQLHLSFTFFCPSRHQLFFHCCWANKHLLHIQYTLRGYS